LVSEFFKTVPSATKECEPPKTAQTPESAMLQMFWKVTRWKAKTAFKVQLHFVTKMSLQGRC